MASSRRHPDRDLLRLLDLHHDDSSTRDKCRRWLRRNRAGWLGAVRNGMSNADPHIRRACIDALELIRAPHRTRAILATNAIDDPDLWVKYGACGALSQIKTRVPQTIQCLCKAASHHTWQVRQAAIEALASVGHSDRRALQAIITAINDEVSNVRIIACSALIGMRVWHESATKQLVRRLNDSEAAVRAAACHALLASGLVTINSKILSNVGRRLDDSDYGVRIAACRLFARYDARSSRTNDRLRRNLSVSDSDLVEAAAEALRNQKAGDQ